MSPRIDGLRGQQGEKGNGSVSLRETVDVLIVEPDDAAFGSLRDQLLNEARQAFKVDRAATFKAASLLAV